MDSIDISLFQLGLFLIVPILGALFVTSLLFRVHSLRVLRIYQKREHPERYTIVAPSNWGTLKKVSIFFSFYFFVARMLLEIFEYFS